MRRRHHARRTSRASPHPGSGRTSPATRSVPGRTISRARRDRHSSERRTCRPRDAALLTPSACPPKPPGRTVGQRTTARASARLRSGGSDEDVSHPLVGIERPPLGDSEGCQLAVLVAITLVRRLTFDQVVQNLPVTEIVLQRERREVKLVREISPARLRRALRRMQRVDLRRRHQHDHHRTVRHIEHQTAIRRVRVRREARKPTAFSTTAETRFATIPASMFPR